MRKKKRKTSISIFQSFVEVLKTWKFKGILLENGKQTSWVKELE
jgi:hypothetical protein